MDLPHNSEKHPTQTKSSERPAGGDELGTAGVSGVFSRDGLLVWQGGAGRLTIGWSAIVIGLVLMVGAWSLSGRPGDSDLPSLALLGILMAAAGSTFQAGVHLLICHLHQALPSTLVLTAAGFRTVPEGLFGMWLLRRQKSKRSLRQLARQRLGQVAGPPLALCLAAFAAWGVDWLWAGGFSNPQNAFLTERASSLGVVFRSPAEIATWMWLLQAAWCVLPIPGCQGRAMLESCSLLVHVSRTETSPPLVIVRRVDMVQSMLAIAVVVAGIYLWQTDSTSFSIPSWPFVIALGILMWSGRKPDYLFSSAQTIEMASLSERGSHSERGSLSVRGPHSERGAKVSKGLGWVGRWRVRRAQRTERAEAMDDKQLDQVLDKLHSQGPESLSAVERKLLERVSRRLREEAGSGKDKD